MTADWNRDDFVVEIHDDGPGFSLDILSRLGEPYLGRGAHGATRTGGLGLGFFIAKTLLERTGARVAFDNRPWEDQSAAAGAWVAARWPRGDIFIDEG